MKELAREGGKQMKWVIRRDSAVPVNWRKAATGARMGSECEAISVCLPHRGHVQAPDACLSDHHFWDKGSRKLLSKAG